MTPTQLFLFLAAATLSACASTPGARPSDMSASNHDTEARKHEGEAQHHAAQIDPEETQTGRPCEALNQAGASPCWTPVRNPTSGHAEESLRHRQMAADHRASSQTLRDAEASACAGLSDADRDTSPFGHPGDVVGADALYSPERGTTKAPARLVGASITVRAVPGLTKEYLQRLVNCHVARNASMGHAMPEMVSCPLSVKGASATVESAGAAFMVKVRADESKAAQEIGRRAKAITATK